MRRIIVIEFVSLDGVVQAPGGPQEDPSGGFAYGGWIAPFSDSVLGAVMKTQLGVQADLLLGRKTFEIWSAYWPHHGEIWPRVNPATKYVASNTLESTTWQPTVILRGDIVPAIHKLKQKEGPDLHVYGSADLVQTLLRHDLVDALWLKIYPITLGSGKRLFARGTIPAAFSVVESHVSSKGVLIVNYERSGAVATGAL